MEKTMVEDKEADLEIEVKEPEIKADPEIKIEDAKEPEPKKKVALSAEDGIKKLQDQLNKEKQGRIQAEYRANQSDSKVVQLENEVGQSQKSTLDNAIAFAKTERINLKQKYSAALAAGNFDEATELNEQIADMAAKMLNLENGKVALEQRPKTIRQAPNDPVEAFVSNMTKPSADWLRGHSDYVTNPKLNKKMIAAHNMALADDLIADTPEYFSYVEKSLGIENAKDEPEDEAVSDAAKPVARRSSPAAAPVSRSMGSDGKKINVVTLTREEREFAEMNGQTPQEYATQKLILQNEGRLGQVNRN